MNTSSVENPLPEAPAQDFVQTVNTAMKSTRTSVENDSAEETDLAENSSDQSESLELVRKILFGEQVRKTEKRQASLERHIQTSVEALNTETSNHIDMLKIEIAVLTDLFEEEVQVRKANLLSNQDTTSRIERSISDLSQQTANNHRELNQRLDTEKNKLSQQMQDWRQDILQQLQDATNALSHEKTDRQSLAVLLTEMADQLVAEDSASR